VEVNSNFLTLLDFLFSVIFLVYYFNTKKKLLLKKEAILEKNKLNQEFQKAKFDKESKSINSQDCSLLNLLHL
jgi:cell division protein FtsL